MFGIIIPLWIVSILLLYKIIRFLLWHLTCKAKDLENLFQGNPKIHETFFRACLSIWKVLSGNYGNVRVDFCQPFSLKVCTYELKIQ